jgi:hypothetical protein
MLKGLNILKSLVAWYFINLILPIAIPNFFLWACKFPTGENKSFCDIFIELLRNGAYIFTGTLLIFSIFQDSKIAKQVVEWYDYLVLFAFLFLVGIIYMSDNPINSMSNTFDFKKEFQTAENIFIFGILYAGFIKLKVLWYQHFKKGFVELSKELKKKVVGRID